MRLIEWEVAEDGVPLDVHVFHLLKIKRTFRFFNSLTLNRVCINHRGSHIAMPQ